MGNPLEFREQIMKKVGQRGEVGRPILLKIKEQSNKKLECTTEL